MPCCRDECAFGKAALHGGVGCHLSATMHLSRNFHCGGVREPCFQLTRADTRQSSTFLIESIYSFIDTFDMSKKCCFFCLFLSRF